MSTTPGNASDCIIERETPHGYWWRYQHSDDEPRDTLLAAIVGLAQDPQRRWSVFATRSSITAALWHRY
jgi:hypothetical protein